MPRVCFCFGDLEPFRYIKSLLVTVKFVGSNALLGDLREWEWASWVVVVGDVSIRSLK